MKSPKKKIKTKNTKATDGTELLPKKIYLIVNRFTQTLQEPMYSNKKDAELFRSRLLGSDNFRVVCYRKHHGKKRKKT